MCPCSSATPSSAAATCARAVREVLDGVAQVQAQRASTWSLRERPACRRAPAAPILLREQRLERGLPVLEIERHGPLAARVGRGDLAQAVADRGEVGVVHQAGVVQHLGVRDRGLHVVGHQPVVERVVLAGGVAQHPLVERRALVPESRHCVAPCSAALSALVSATTSVPVPSLVKISASSASGAA